MTKENNATILFNLLYDFKNKLKGILTGDKDCGMISVLRFIISKILDKPLDKVYLCTVVFS